MAYKVRCSACGKSMRLPEGEAGLPVVCLACGTKFVAPSKGEAEAGDAPAPGLPGATPVTPPPAKAPESLAAVPVATAVPVPLPANLTPPRRVSWLVAAVVCAALVLLSVGGWTTYRWVERKAGVHALNAMLAEAEDLAAEGDLESARRKYRELDRRATELGVDDPDIKAIADQARGQQEQVFATMLAQQASPGATFGAAAPGTAPPPPPPAETATTAPAEPPAAVVSEDEVPTNVAATPPASTRPAVVVDRVPAIEAQTAAGDDPIAMTPGVKSPTDSAATTKPVEPTPQRVVARPRLRPVPEPVVGISDEEIGDSIQRGVDHLIKLFDKKDAQVRMPQMAGDEGYVCGLNALCVYALLQSGQAIPDQRLNVRGPYMKSLIEGMKRLPANRGKATYARGIRATALALYDRKEDRSALRADVAYLVLTHAEGAYTYAGQRTSSSVRGSPGAWDNSNSQYGLLGAWSGAEVGVEVPGDYWVAVQKHWATCQVPDGTWNYTRGNAGTVSMTAAGTASLFVAEDYLYGARFGARVGREPFSPPLKRALDWWERTDLASMPVSGWWGYTMYGIERVGLASGFKYFGAHDWYRELAAQVVRRQRADGSWGDPIDTSYALLFLARGRHPILMNKLRFDRGGSTGETAGYWANRPRDAANLARYAGRQLERPLNWQVVNLDREWHDWLDSPILSIASHRAPFFTDADCDKFRSYAEAGGMIYLQADGDSAEFDAFADRFTRRLFPQYEMKELPPAHPLYSTVYKVTPPAPLKAVSNGARILMLYSPRDLARAWQLRDDKGKGGVFQLGVNMFVYAAGKRELRNRLSSPYVSTPQGRPPNGIVDVVRIKYAGAWDPEPGAWRRFAPLMHRQTGTAPTVDVVSLKLLSSDLPARFAHMTGDAAYRMTDEDKSALRAYVDAGGVVFVDACGGDAAFADSIKAALGEAFPDQLLQTMSRDHPLFEPGAPGMDDLRRPRMRVFALERSVSDNPKLHVLRSGKGVVLLSDLDVTSGLLGTETWGIYGYEPSYAQALMKNLIFWTMDGKPE